MPKLLSQRPVLVTARERRGAIASAIAKIANTAPKQPSRIAGSCCKMDISSIGINL
jgi:hypothetical protein